MKQLMPFAVAAVLLSACHKSVNFQTTDAPTVEANWSTTAQFGSETTSDGYNFNNDVWGSGAGPQTLWVNSSSNWGVWSNQPNTGGVKSYAHAARYVGKLINSLITCTSSFNVTVPGTGSYESTYDIWDSNNANEIMLWMNYTGSVSPISSTYNASGKPVPAASGVTVGGHTWNVYRGSNGSNAVFSFVRTSNTSSGSVDIRAILKWIESEGWIGNVTLGNVEFGYEITSSSGGLNFDTNSYSVTSN
jgi:Glycosyl hydrolase family 12